MKKETEKSTWKGVQPVITFISITVKSVTEQDEGRG